MSQFNIDETVGVMERQAELYATPHDFWMRDTCRELKKYLDEKAAFELRLKEIEDERDQLLGELSDTKNELETARFELSNHPDAREVWFRPVDLQGYPPGTYLIMSYKGAPGAVGPFYAIP